MSPSSTPRVTPRSSRRRGWWIGGGAALIIIVAAAVLGSIAWAQSGDRTHPGPSSAAVGSQAPGVSNSASPVPSVSTSNPPVASDAPAPGRSSSPVPFDKIAEPVGGVTIGLSSLESVSGTGTGIGEIAGPSIRFRVVFTNSSAKEVSLAGAVVNVYYGTDARPAIQLSGPGGVALPASVVAGASASGVYIYNVPTAQRGDVRITVSLTTDAPVTVFQGSAPR